MKNQSHTTKKLPKHVVNYFKTWLLPHEFSNRMNSPVINHLNMYIRSPMYISEHRRLSKSMKKQILKEQISRLTTNNVSNKNLEIYSKYMSKNNIANTNFQCMKLKGRLIKAVEKYNENRNVSNLTSSFQSLGTSVSNRQKTGFENSLALWFTPEEINRVNISRSKKNKLMNRFNNSSVLQRRLTQSSWRPVK